MKFNILLSLNMPLTSTERSRIRREKLKADEEKYRAYKRDQSKKKKRI